MGCRPALPATRFRQQPPSLSRPLKLVDLRTRRGASVVDSTDLSSLRKGYYGASLMPVEVLGSCSAGCPKNRLGAIPNQVHSLVKDARSGCAPPSPPVLIMSFLRSSAS